MKIQLKFNTRTEYFEVIKDGKLLESHPMFMDCLEMFLSEIRENRDNGS